MTEKPSFAAFDVASLVIVSRGGLDRCLDTVLAAQGSDPGVRSATAMLGSVYAALERVLVAHVSCDAFVFERTGARVVFERLAAQGVPLLGVAPFSLPIAQALARRFRWPEQLLLEARTGSDAIPLYGVVEAAARSLGWALERGAFVSDDLWELRNAADAGCPRPIAITDPAAIDADGEHGVTLARSMRELLHVLLPSQRTLRSTEPRIAVRDEAS